MGSNESVNQLFADLHAHRVATFKPEDLAVNVNQRNFLLKILIARSLSKSAMLSMLSVYPKWVATDFGNELGHKFGIVFTADEASQQSALAKGNNIGDTIGTGTSDLPMPAVIVIDQNHIVRYVEVSPDWLVRTEADPIIEAVRSVVSLAKAA